jgi:SulP family sulfate permease
LGAIESLLCARVADNMSDLPRHDPNQELMAQGIANIVTPFFGGMPATGTIARTSTNVRSGARTPVAGIVHALTILAVMLLAAPLAMHVPLAALAGILLHVAWNMGEWHEFARLRHFTMNYRIILVGTFLLTVIFDLTVAVEVGLILACVFFVYRMNRLFRTEWAPDLAPGMGLVKLYGTLFFGAVGRIESLSEQVRPEQRVLILEMHRLIFVDTSGIDALRQLMRVLRRKGVDLVLADANDQPRSILTRSGLELELGPHHIFDSVETAVAHWTAAAGAEAANAAGDEPAASSNPRPT